MVDEILLIIAGLAGLGGLISIIVNLLKIVGIVKDGTSQTWFQVLDLIAFLVVAVLYFLKMPVDWTKVNDWLVLLSTVIGYVASILGGQLTYNTIGGKTPVIGFSYTKKDKVVEDCEEKVSAVG